MFFSIGRPSCTITIGSPSDGGAHEHCMARPAIGEVRDGALSRVDTCFVVIALLSSCRLDARVFGGAPFAVLGHLCATTAPFHLAPAAAATARTVEVHQ